MIKRKWAFDLTGIALAIVFMLAACSPSASTPAPATPTASQQPALPTATTAASPTALVPTLPAATATVLSTITPTAATVAQASPGWNANCRKGPGSFYFIVTVLQANSFYPVVGRDGLDTWWLVQVTPTVQCWEGDPTTVTVGPVKSTPLIAAPLLPSTAYSFNNTSHCNPVLNTMTVWLTWVPAHNATGYNIYRNGSLIAKLGATAIAYTDNAPRGVNLKYQIEAFNDYGVSSDATTKVNACV